ncbi:hypothetical protein EDB86DRAFT_3245552 [Lactarius hatsudake]|nr:hypothetical protein EDB86DRAFT_3245552 [Lactarius hatsudake]
MAWNREEASGAERDSDSDMTTIAIQVDRLIASRTLAAGRCPAGVLRRRPSASATRKPPNPATPVPCDAPPFDMASEEGLLRDIVDGVLAQGVWITRARRVGALEKRIRASASLSRLRRCARSACTLLAS